MDSNEGKGISVVSALIVHELCESRPLSRISDWLNFHRNLLAAKYCPLVLYLLESEVFAHFNLIGFASHL